MHTMALAEALYGKAAERIRDAGERWWREWCKPVLPPEYVDALLATGTVVPLSKADLPAMQRWLDATYPEHQHHVTTQDDRVWIRRCLSTGSLTARVVEELALRGVGAPVQAAELAAALGETRVRVGRVLTRLSRRPGDPVIRGPRRRVRAYRVGPAIIRAAARRSILLPISPLTAANDAEIRAADFRVAA